MNAAAGAFDGLNKYIRITDIDEESRCYIDENPVSPKGELDDKYLVRENDILFARTGASTGKTYLYKKSDGKLYFAGFLIRISVNCDNNSTFVYNATLTDGYNRWVQLTSMRSGQPGINSQEYSSYKTYYPLLHEQNKIVSFLKKLDQRIEKQRQLVEALKSYKRGLFKQFFDTNIQGSSLFPLADLVECHDNKRIPVNSQARSSRQGIYPYYGANGIQGYIDDYIFDGEFILLAEDGGHFDEFLYRPIAQYVNGKCWVNNHAHILEATKCNSKYLFYILEHMDIRSYINGTSRAKLNQKDMLTILIPCPNAETQVFFALVVSAVDDVIKKAIAILETLERYKAGLLQHLFI